VVEIIWADAIRELERLETHLHAIWVAGRDDSAARRSLKRLMTLCGEVMCCQYGADRSALAGWKRLMKDMAQEEHTTNSVHLSCLLWGRDPEVESGRRRKPRQFPTEVAYDSARSCLDVIQLLKDREWRAEQRRAALRQADRAAGQRRDAGWAKLRDFPVNRKSAIRKAAGRGKTIRTRVVPGQREKLYSVEDVVGTYGEAARPS
jgi:hypothetical protein